MPIEHSRELVFDEFADNGYVTVAEGVGNNVTRRRGQKNHGYRRNDSRGGHRDYDLEKGLRARRAEIGGSFENVFIELYKHRVKRENGKRQVVVNHTDNSVYHAEFTRFVHSDFKQQFFHRRRSQNEVYPHRENKKHQNDVFPFHFRTREDIGYGISDEKTDNRRYNRKPETDVNGADIRRASEKVNEILKRKGKFRYVVRREVSPFHGERVQNDEKKRQNHKQTDKDGVRDSELLSRKFQSFHFTCSPP